MLRCARHHGRAQGQHHGNTACGSISTPIIERICSDIVSELQREGLTSSQETFLEWQRPYVEEHIVSDAPCLHSL